MLSCSLSSEESVLKRGRRTHAGLLSQTPGQCSSLGGKGGPKCPLNWGYDSQDRHCRMGRLDLFQGTSVIRGCVINHLKTLCLCTRATYSAHASVG